MTHIRAPDHKPTGKDKKAHIVSHTSIGEVCTWLQRSRGSLLGAAAWAGINGPTGTYSNPEPVGWHPSRLLRPTQTRCVDQQQWVHTVRGSVSGHQRQRQTAWRGTHLATALQQQLERSCLAVGDRRNACVAFGNRKACFSLQGTRLATALRQQHTGSRLAVGGRRDTRSQCA